MSKRGWDWDAIAASDYPAAVDPRALKRDAVYCEFWTTGLDGSYGYFTGLVIPWLEWLDLRETAAGVPLDALMFSPLRGIEGVSLYTFTRARFSIWTAFANPRFPRVTIGLWSLERGFGRE